jgi:acyl carrier protein
MQHEQIRNTIRRFIIEQSNLEDTSFLQDDTSLFEAGLLDSLLTVSLVAFFESEFGCDIAMTDMSEENFRSIRSLTELISFKLEAAREGQ